MKNVTLFRFLFINSLSEDDARWRTAVGDSFVHISYRCLAMPYLFNKKIKIYFGQQILKACLSLRNASI